MDNCTPTQARKNLFKIASDVNNNHNVISVNNVRKPNQDMVIMSKNDYKRMLETMHVINNGQLQESLDRSKNAKKEDFIDITNGINWDDL
ncbi:hypothetical protein BGL34_03750 [Fructilactobacillus lindneri]|uniref:Antitoxin n=1 Tax=Fructilactobacillus lindneri TaxID=53444 RepID=A0AB33BRM1_9LACO|nr:type II toxin-antitoxin system Phd/YefM family antitoxin [Fructilactobacillus lindneri]ANZ57764.1 hypothetical protein AYR60_02785 [Fructilactobacillus lindneri]ANZ59033.1 hypothetical protein AYR59_02785 [Fructilactobacillus lindneri]POG98087.1 hypothetical protein BGL31_03115 [Fructilactobacillus lindneri]POH01798.1 hypothetical protein BGL32_04315 [Fructilactobacillus lindneri]POH03642.1 hypothetical protein BGL33_03200 [Fructilactobacillus lindneri]